MVVRQARQLTVGIALASSREPMTTRGARHQFLSFSVAGEELAVRVLRLCEVLLADAMRALPSSKSAVRGVLDYEGRILPVIDVGPKFGLTSCPIAPPTRVMIVVVPIGGERRAIGVLVEGVTDGFELARRRIQRAPSTMAGAKCLIGTARLEDRSIPLIDVDRLLSRDDRELMAALRSSEREPSTVDKVELPWKTA